MKLIVIGYFALSVISFLSISIEAGSDCAPYGFLDTRGDCICYAGYYYNYDNGGNGFGSGFGHSESCKACAPGKYQSGSGYLLCYSCLPGQYQSGSSMTNCTDCPAGSYSTQTSATECVSCNTGEYSTTEGLTSQDFCTSSGLPTTTKATNKVETTSIVPSSKIHDISTSIIVLSTYTQVERSSILSNSTTKNHSALSLLLTRSESISSTYPSVFQSTPAVALSFISSTSSRSFETTGNALTHPASSVSSASNSSSSLPNSTAALIFQSVSLAIKNSFVMTTASTQKTPAPATEGFSSASTRPVSIASSSAVLNVSLASCRDDCGSTSVSPILTNSSANVPQTSSCVSEGTPCVSCITGKYLYVAGNGSRICLACAAGKYSSTNGATGSETCSACPVGTYSSASGSVDAMVCEMCTTGTYTTASASTSNASCDSCQPGKYINQEGSSFCISCPHGKYQAEFGQAICKACGVGTYSTAESSSEANCTPCQSNSSSKEGSSSIGNCTCNNGFYQQMITGATGLASPAKFECVQKANAHIPTCAAFPSDCVRSGGRAVFIMTGASRVQFAGALSVTFIEINVTAEEIQSSLLKVTCPPARLFGSINAYVKSINGSYLCTFAFTYTAIVPDLNPRNFPLPGSVFSFRLNDYYLLLESGQCELFFGKMSVSSFDLSASPVSYIFKAPPVNSSGVYPVLLKCEKYQSEELGLIQYFSLTEIFSSKKLECARSAKCELDVVISHPYTKSVNSEDLILDFSEFKFADDPQISHFLRMPRYQV